MSTCSGDDLTAGSESKTHACFTVRADGIAGAVGLPSLTPLRVLSVHDRDGARRPFRAAAEPNLASFEAETSSADGE